jgi:SAM-dependent methyltransferase
MGRQWSLDDVLKLASAFQPACVLGAAGDLDVFTILQDRQMTGDEVARHLEADPRATEVLLDALAAMELLVKQGERYSVPDDVADVLTQGGRTSKLAMVQHQANCMRRWVELARVVSTGRPADRPPSIRGEAADEASFIEAMDNISGPMAGPLVASLQGLSFRHVLDVGGGSGTWTIALLRAVPGARATLFDLPGVIPFAKKRIGRAGLAERVKFMPGDFYKDPLPKGADFAWLSAIIHQNSRQQNRDLYRKVCAALEDGGTVAVRDMVMDATRTRPVAGAMFAVNMLVGTSGGGTYTLAEIREDLELAGFAEVTMWRRGESMDSVVRAVKPLYSGAGFP